jgi:hypothetical protein
MSDLKEKNEEKVIMFWPILFPVVALLYLYLGIGSFLQKQLKKILNWSTSI